MATDDNSLPPTDLENLVRPQRHWLGVRGYDKITKEYDHDGLSKITSEHQPGRTLWDWVQLLIIPFVIGAGAIWFNMQQSQISLQVSVDQQRGTILQTYIGNIHDLLLNHNLLKSSTIEINNPYYDVALLAQARTLTALQGLDPERKGVLLKFIYEARLIGFFDVTAPANGNKTSDPIFRLFKADLSEAHLFGADLGRADLIDAVITQQQLDQAASCKNALLPQGLTCHHQSP